MNETRQEVREQLVALQGTINATIAEELALLAKFAALDRAADPAGDFTHLKVAEALRWDPEWAKSRLNLAIMLYGRTANPARPRRNGGTPA